MRGKQKDEYKQVKMPRATLTNDCHAKLRALAGHMQMPLGKVLEVLINDRYKIEVIKAAKSLEKNDNITE